MFLYCSTLCLIFKCINCPKLIMARDTKKAIHILQLKYLIRFAQSLLKPTGNSSEKLYRLEGILDIRAI